MNLIRKAAFLIAVFCFVLVLREGIHHQRYGHLVPLGLHADVLVTTSSDLIGIKGIAKIYRARVTNYGILPAKITVCDYYIHGRATGVNYIVERWDRPSRQWKYAPEWDDYGARFFCVPSFETTDEHLSQHWLWPGQSILVGTVIPPRRQGLKIGDQVRFTIFRAADGNGNNALYTAPFLVEQQLKIVETP
jgi:hypothetical protein